MSLRVAITRAAPENERTAARLVQRGATPAVAPLLEIKPVGVDTNIDGAQAVLFTSGNGVRAFARQTASRGVPVLTVGDATARIAHAVGFSDVRSANDDVASLAALAITLLEPRAGKLVHISGAQIAGDLVTPLRNAGFEVERRVAYEAIAAAALPDAFGQKLDIVLFHSARAAQVFASLGAPSAHALTAACLSEAVAEAASMTAWARLIVAPAPREEALLDAALAT